MLEPSSPPHRRIALVCMTPRPDAQELGELLLPSYGIRRIHAALLGDPDLADASVRLFDRRTADIEAYVADILDFEPDLVGFSIYVWSAPAMIAVARAHGMMVMVGCMIESSLGITAAAHFTPLVDIVDLDGAALLSQDPFTGARIDGGQVTLPDGPGLGVQAR